MELDFFGSKKYQHFPIFGSKKVKKVQEKTSNFEVRI